jgi:flavin-dependent dehydrogenase
MDYFLHPGQQGLNLKRPEFDADLARAARSRGAAILTSAVLTRAGRHNGRWYIDVNVGGRTRSLDVPVIVDATGRAATFSRLQGARTRAQDRQIAVVGFCEHAETSCGRSLVETSPSGWWYRAPIGGGRCVCMLVTDDDALPQSGKPALEHWWQEELAGTEHVAGEGGVCKLSSALLVRSARSQYLERAHGEGWLAVGDAALAFDPLASQGIAKALDHGTRAAAQIASYLAGDGAALERFALQLRSDYAAYEKTRTGYYRLEARWPQSPFWQRRHRATMD